MTATLPRPSRPLLNPPSSALPALPNPKSKPRKSSPTSREITDPKPLTTSALPSKIASRSTPAIPHASSSSNVPTLASISKTPSSRHSKSVRRTISISTFPQPPTGAARTSSLPPSPLSGGIHYNTAVTDARRGSSDVHGGGNLRLKRPKTLRGQTSKTLLKANISSFHNGIGSNTSASNSSSIRGIDSLANLPSPPQSRSPSVEGSCSATSTTFEDIDEHAYRAREEVNPTSSNEKRRSDNKEGQGNVIVSVRVRPETGGGDEGRNEGEWLVDGRRSLVAYRGRERGDYYYDNVFATHDSNAKVYDSSAKRLVRRVMQGYHGTVFAYGMTGTGKTFSMQGTTTSPGVIPLAITDIFSYIRETPHREFLLRVSYLEIYNERIHDLLSAPTVNGINACGMQQQEEIKLREDSKRGVYATPLKEEIVQSPTQLLRVIARGDHARRTSSTQYNARSSRSHAVVQIVVESRERLPGITSMQDNKRSALPPTGVRVSTLSLIDLAGSERAAESKERRTEGAHINKSLLTLGTVIGRLSGEKDKSGNVEKDDKHLPYRDSKLTRLLQPALSGNSLISILCTIQIGSNGSVATAHSQTAETLNTLKFAARAKNNIVSHAKRAEEALGSGSGDAGSRVLLERYRMEILDLRSQLDGQIRAKNDEEEKEREKEAEQRHEEQMLEMQLARTALKERIEHLNRLILSSKSTGVNASGQPSSAAQSRLLGKQNGQVASLSRRSSASHSAQGALSGLDRTASMGSTATGHISNEQPPHSPPRENGMEDDDSAGEYGDGTATLTAQVKALQADLADKHRYISTLEKRLLQARRTSHSRTSLCLSPPHKMASSLEEDGGMTSLIHEKDAEIADLRARLDDKDRMVTALRSAARKRDIADLVSEPTSAKTRNTSGRTSERSSGGIATNGVLIGPVSPVAPAAMPLTEVRKTRSVDEMSKLLDEMIQDRVESGQVVKTARGLERLGSERKRAPVDRGSLGVEALKGLSSQEVCQPVV
ncbi:MAG: hypothetical protein M1835_000653 [Candelina submexicana]|nr:MAG: hypothetical protein M1835_000653 [Candelina submexicana]